MRSSSVSILQRTSNAFWNVSNSIYSLVVCTSCIPVERPEQLKPWPEKISGEAMGAAIAEITRLEEEYMTLFVGYSECQTQKMQFEVVPASDQENQMYIAFRLSDTDGLVPADNLSGKPVIMQIIPQEFAQTEVSAEEQKNKKEVLAYYRIPAVCTVKLMDGANLLLQSRMPVYQLGQESSLPVNVILK